MEKVLIVRENMKKNIKYLLLLLVSPLAFTACDYLNVDEYFEDTFKEDSIFSSETHVKQYYNGAVNMLPNEAEIYEHNYADCALPGITGSDEAVAPDYTWGGLAPIRYAGTMLTMDEITFTSGEFNIWGSCYKVIRKCNTILSRLNEVPMNTFDKIEFRAQVRFLRAYAYFWLFRNYGPVLLLGDEVMEVNGEASIYRRYRATFDETVDYICSEFETAAADLPLKNSSDMVYAPTRGAALALVARIRLQAASPLFNGGDVARRYYSNFKRSSDGVNYISQEYDESKWAQAAAAAKRVMDMNVYSLYTFEDEGEYASKFLPADVKNYPEGPGGIDPYRSYIDQFNGEALAYTNPELIWGTDRNVGGYAGNCFPLQYGGNGTVSVPQRMVDMYYMIDGRETSNASSQYPYENRPYDNNCVTTADKIISPDNYILKSGTFKAYDNREPRFYANIAFSHSYWFMNSCTETNKKNVAADYFSGGNSGKSRAAYSGVYYVTGYSCRKWVHPRDARTGSGALVVPKVYPILRYAEVLLNYAEALNNLKGSYTIDGKTYTRDTEEIAKAFNLVRYRAGLPGLTEAELADPEKVQELIVRERCVEFFHEGLRFYDIRRWGIVEDLEREPLTGCNADATQWAGFYAPTIIQYASIRERTFNSKMILLPIQKDELRKVPTLDQNPGWDK